MLGKKKITRSKYLKKLLAIIQIIHSQEADDHYKLRSSKFYYLFLVFILNILRCPFTSKH